MGARVRFETAPTGRVDARVGLWLPTVLAAIFVPLHVAAWAILLLRVPMGVIPVLWLWRAVVHGAWLVWWVWLVI